jgi:hypothetical protein
MEGKRMKLYPDRIPYDVWISSQLSVARYYGGMMLNGSEYRIEKPSGDLVKVEAKSKKKKK